MARRKKTLGSSARTHVDRANAAHDKARRFIKRAEDGLRSGANCDDILLAAANARGFGMMAVSEAAGAARRSSSSGPTALQRATSKTDDRALYLFYRVAHRCARKKPK